MICVDGPFPPLYDQRMPVRCPSCQEEWPDRMRFCGLCGTPLATLEKEEERKPVSVLFVDLVGFTQLSEHRDVEEVQSFLDRFFTLVNATVSRYGGHVDKLIGDAALILFGVPKAMENHAFQAVRAALDLLEKARREGYALHLGIHSGEVLVTRMGSGQASDYTVLGDTVNVAQRVQGLSGTNELLISGVTYALVEGTVEAVYRGKVRVKNRAEPVHLWQVKGVKRGAFARGLRTLLPFVGRDAERQRLDQVLQERDHVLVSVIGEAGLGKSRLVEEVLGSLPVRVLYATPDRQPLGLFSGDEQGHAVKLWLEAHPEGVLHVEDLHWCDPLSLQVLEQILGGLAPPLRVVVTTRPEGLPLLERLEDAFSFRGGETVRLEIGPLPPADIEELLEGMDLPPDIRERLVEKVQGNPLFLEEYLQARRTGMLQEIPERLEGLFAAQVDALPPDLKERLKTLSVLGSSFPLHHVLLVGLPPDDPDLRALVNRGMVRMEGDTLKFRHPLLRDVVWRSMLLRKRRALHAEVLSRLERQGGSPHALTHHAYQAQMWEKVEFYGLRGARYLLRVGDPRGALKLVEWVEEAIRHTGNTAVRVHMNLLRARALHAVGDRQGARKLLDMLIEEVEPSHPLYEEVWLEWAELRGVMGEASRALKMLSTRLTPPYRHPERVTLVQASLHVEAGQYAEAEAVLSRLYKEFDDEMMREEVAIELARVLVLQMELDRLETLVRTLLPGAGDRPRLEAYLTHWMAVGRRLQGRLEEARALHERALDIVRERGLRESWPVFLLEYARLLQRMGEMEEAGRMLERVRILSQRYGDLKTALNASMDQAQWLLHQQQLEEAVRRFQEVLGEAEAQGDRHSVVRILHNLGALYLLYLGDVPRAREVLERCLNMPEVHDEAVVLHVSRLLMGVIHMLTGRSPSLPEETQEWLARVPSRVVQALAHGFPQLGIPIGDASHPSFPDLLTPDAFGEWIERLVREGPHQLLRLALWWAETRDPSHVEVYRERYRKAIRKAGLPKVYAAALPFLLQT